MKKWLSFIAVLFLVVTAYGVESSLFSELKARAEKGDAKAQYNLGLMYEKGQRVTQDYAQAIKWYRKAAGQGYAQAQNNFGEMYRLGQGVTQNYNKAVKWYRKAAKQGYALAQYNLGLMNHHGLGVTQNYYKEVFDYDKAVNWHTDDGLNDGLNQASYDAQFKVESMYKKGRVVNKNYGEAVAVKWYRKAAEQGLAKAQYNLGVAYDDGDGVTQDYKEAYKWFRIVAAAGDSNSEKRLDNLKLVMTTAQIKEAELRAEEWLVKHQKKNPQY